jgi:phosphate/sulfate permease
MFGLDLPFTILLLICLLAAAGFEFINGFHDTANAVATVIYTHSLKPTSAVIWSGLWNFIGVNVGGIAVAMGIVNLIPLEMLVDQNLVHGISMIFALIITAIVWNLATWYIGLPCSSSHTLIGSIFGVGIAFMLLPGSHAVSLNWPKMGDAILALFISPVIGFGLAFGLMYLLQKLIRNKDVFKAPTTKKPPPLLIRSIIVLTSTCVSFAHGSNDGQKGIGLVMLILIGFAPVYFAVDRTKSAEKLFTETKTIEWTLQKIDSGKLATADQAHFHAVMMNLRQIKRKLTGVKSFEKLAKEDHFQIRQAILTVGKNADLLIQKLNKENCSLNSVRISVLKANLRKFKDNTEYSPRWVILLVSISLGLGTMIGWKRIVVTIGEKIGKTHLNYAQGATSNLIAAGTIVASSMFGLPVSTTHVLSSAVGGTMVAGAGRQNLKMGTVKNILIAWLITLPVTILLSGLLFFIFRMIFK